MQFYNEYDITEFFDLSIILPFYKKLKEFKKVLPKNLKYFQRNGIELIIVLDTPDEEKELINYLSKFPFLNAKVIVNRILHDWRNPSKAINVGIKKSNRKYILIASPETEFLTDVIYQLRYILQYNPSSFALGQVVFLGLNEVPVFEQIQNYDLLPYGSIMVEKKHLIKIGGYSEKLTNWGGDDDNIRARLEMAGVRKMLITQAIAIHREEKSEGHKSRHKKSKNRSIANYKEILYPQKLFVNKNCWGTDFDEIIYDWEKKVKKNNVLII